MIVDFEITDADGKTVAEGEGHNCKQMPHYEESTVLYLYDAALPQLQPGQTLTIYVPPTNAGDDRSAGGA